MEYYIIKNAAKPSPGAPVNLQALLHEAFSADGANKGMTYKWVCRADALPERGSPFSFPDELWLISKDKRYDFDCRLAHAGLLVSEKFLSLLEPHDRADFKIAKVHAVDKDKKSISDKKIYYIKFKPITHAVDRQKTEFIQAKFGSDLAFDRDGRPVIGLVKSLVLDKEKVAGRNLFVSHDLVGSDTFISSALRDKIRAEKLLGIDDIPMADFFSAEQSKVAGIERNYGRPLADIETVKEG